MSDATERDRDDERKLVLEYDLDAPPEKVWRAVTHSGASRALASAIRSGGTRTCVVGHGRGDLLSGPRGRAAISRKQRDLPDRAKP